MDGYISKYLAVLTLETIRQEYAMHDEADQIVAKRCLEEIRELPAADVAPVVRCKECEFHTFLGKCKVHSQEPDQYGPGHDVTMAPDDFCSYGKRKQLEE